MTPVIEYEPDAWLSLSGIQHFIFCRRQWALIHVERQWQENALTADGRILHHRVDDPFFTEKRKNLIIARSVPVCSSLLGLSGVCDAVEFVAAPAGADGGARLPGRSGSWLPAPVEYKRGHAKRDPCDEAQLCAQAMCLEEMLVCAIPYGHLYYGQTRHRETVDLTSDLRELVRKAVREMHAYNERGHTPQVKATRACRSCSLADVCLPMLQGSGTPASVYIRQQLERA